MESVEQRRQRHLNWIALNANVFSAEGPRAYRESGRGAFVATAAPGPPQLVSPEYWTTLNALPDTADGLNIFRMIREYDPATQFVIVIRDPDDYSVHVYVVGLTT